MWQKMEENPLVGELLPLLYNPPMKEIITYLFLLLFFVPQLAHSEPMRVGFDGDYEEKILELAPTETGTVTVFLKSSGRPLEGYHVGLVRYQDKKVMMSVVTDEQGEVRFANVPAARYIAMILRAPKEQFEDNVSIGDVLVSRYQQDDAGKTEKTNGADDD